MTTFAIQQQRTQQKIFTAPPLVDALAKGWLVALAIYYWIKISQPKAEVYLLSRFDLARRHIGPIPPAHWRVGGVFVAAALAVLWQESVVTLVGALLSRGLASCLA